MTDEHCCGNYGRHRRGPGLVRHGGLQSRLGRKTSHIRLNLDRFSEPDKGTELRNERLLASLNGLYRPLSWTTQRLAVIAAVWLYQPARLFVRHQVDVAGGAEGNRTPDLLNAIQALSQLSYGPDR
jgi:hypothetical protein